MNLAFSAPHVDGPLKTHWDALIRVVGSFTVVIDGTHWYEELDFCLVEFAKALIDWLDDLSAGPKDFVYSSLESDEPELLRFAYAGEQRWQLRSGHELFREDRTLSTDDLVLAAQEYLYELRDRLPERQRVLALLDAKDVHRRLVHLLRGDRD